MKSPVKILVVEDSDIDIEFIKHELSAAGVIYTTREVQNEESYTHALNDFSPDIILSDFSLPYFDGPTAFALRQKISPSVPFIFVSGNIGEERSVEYLKAGVTDYVLKDKMFTLPGKVNRALAEAMEKQQKLNADKALKKANRLYAFLSKINKTIVHVKEDSVLYETTCKIALAEGKFEVAWVALFDTGSKMLTNGGQQGISEEDLYLLQNVPYHPSGPQQHILNTGRHFICNNIPRDPLLQSWKMLAEKYNLHSFIVLPIRRNGNIIGSLNLYSSEYNFFDKQEIALLEEISADISFALEMFDNMNQHRRSGDLIAASEKSYSDLFELSPQPMCLYEMNTFRFIQINKAAIEHYGYSKEEFLTMTLLDLVPADERQYSVATVAAQKRELNKTYTSHSKNYKKNGDLIEVDTFSTPIIINGEITTLVIAVDVTEKNLFDHKITKAIIKTQDDERYEIGGELHDNVCQILAASQMALGMFREKVAVDTTEWLDKGMDYIRLASNEIRNLSHRLAPVFFEESTMEEAFVKLFNTFTMNDEVDIVMNFDKSVGQSPLSLEMQLNLYRILQEQMRNILKYAAATTIEIDVIVYHNKLKMRIADNGVGFDPSAIKSGIGLANMRRRTELFSGNFEIESAPGKGCVVIVDIPLKAMDN